MFYTLVNSEGKIEFSQFTQDNSGQVKEGYRLLPDTTPSFNPDFQYALRVEPVPSDATEIPYTVNDLSNEIIAEQQRTKRDEKLRLEVDSINAIRWESFSDSDKTLWRNYRQALLDVPQQTGFPKSINWPTKPGV